MSDNKPQFFTLERLGWCLVYDLMIVGALACWVVFRWKVLGHGM